MAGGKKEESVTKQTLDEIIRFGTGELFSDDPELSKQVRPGYGGVAAIFLGRLHLPAG
jgi:hypothetical protein